MSEQSIILQLEIPSEVIQQDVWNMEEQIGQVAGITTELQEPKDLISPTLLFIHMVEPYIAQAVSIVGGIQAIRDLAQILYDFLHPAKQERAHQRGKNKIIIIKKEKRIELYNLSPEEIVQVLREQ